MACDVEMLDVHELLNGSKADELLSGSKADRGEASGGSQAESDEGVIKQYAAELDTWSRARFGGARGGGGHFGWAMKVVRGVRGVLGESDKGLALGVCKGVVRALVGGKGVSRGMYVCDVCMCAQYVRACV